MTLNKAEALTIEKVFGALVETADSELTLERRVLQNVEEDDTTLFEEVSRAIDDLEKSKGIFLSIINKLCQEHTI